MFSILDLRLNSNNCKVNSGVPRPFLWGKGEQISSTLKIKNSLKKQVMSKLQQYY